MFPKMLASNMRNNEKKSRRLIYKVKYQTPTKSPHNKNHALKDKIQNQKRWISPLQGQKYPLKPGE